MATYKIPVEIYTILKKVDILGFDRLNDCGNAILTHDDYVERWDICDGSLTSSELSQLQAWKNETLAMLTEYSF